MQTKQSVAYELFVEVRAAHTRKTEMQVQAEISLEQFEEQLRTQHQQYMAREFTIGKLADLLEVPPLNLYDILEEMDLPVRYT
jgi:hypothetical protein